MTRMSLRDRDTLERERCAPKTRNILQGKVKYFVTEFEFYKFIYFGMESVRLDTLTSSI